jgi:hypothetical protein
MEHWIKKMRDNMIEKFGDISVDHSFPAFWKIDIVLLKEKVKDYWF